MFGKSVNSYVIITAISGLVGCLSVSALLQAEDKPLPPAGHGDNNSLERDMGAMGRSLKQIKKQIDDPKQNESSLQLLSVMEKATLASKDVYPPQFHQLTGEELSKARTGYRKMLVTTLQQELTLEEQLLNGDNKNAVQTIKDIESIEKQGHNEFRKEDDEAPAPQHPPEHEKEKSPHGN